MSGSSTKQLQRHIRKAFGPEAMGVIAEHANKIEDAQAALARLDNLQAALAQHVDIVTAKHGETIYGRHAPILAKQQSALESLNRRTQFAVRLTEAGLFRRVWWMLTGIV